MPHRPQPGGGEIGSKVRFGASEPSIRALADYLGHSDTGFTLRTYTHLKPQAEDKAKRAVDDVFERLEMIANDSLRGPGVAPLAV